MRKLFISIPMRGKSTEQIIEEWTELAAKAQAQLNEDFIIIQSIFPQDDTKHPLVYLGRSIMLMADADVVYFALGWEDSRGCVIEHMAATKYDKICIMEEGEN